jgi:hypothetical protein
MATSSSFSGPGGSPAHASPGGGGGGGGGGSYHHHRSRFGDTTLTKVFVGGLAWETPSEGLRQHFDVYGEILEAVVITDRETGRSKGYGFVSGLLPLSLSISPPTFLRPIGPPPPLYRIGRRLPDVLCGSAGDFPGPGRGGAGGAEPEPGDRRPARQLQHCGVRPAAGRAAER